MLPAHKSLLLLIQVDKALKVIKADAMASAVLGHTTNSLYGQHLGNFLRLPIRTSLSSLMGEMPDKMKRSLSHIGPKLEFEGLHSDGLPLKVLFQATIKNDKPGCNRLLACIKCKGSVLGNADLLRDMIVKMVAARPASLQKVSSMTHVSKGDKEAKEGEEKAEVDKQIFAHRPDHDALESKLFSKEITESDVQRGMRLKRLLKLLSGKKATTDLRRLHLHTWFMIGLMLALHLLCFIVILVFSGKQKVYVSAVVNAGGAVSTGHVVTTYNRAIEATLRGYAFNKTSDMKFLYWQMTDHIDSLEMLQTVRQVFQVP